MITAEKMEQVTLTSGSEEEEEGAVNSAFRIDIGDIQEDPVQDRDEPSKPCALNLPPSNGLKDVIEINSDSDEEVLLLQPLSSQTDTENINSLPNITQRCNDHSKADPRPPNNKISKLYHRLVDGKTSAKISANISLEMQRWNAEAENISALKPAAAVSATVKPKPTFTWKIVDASYVLCPFCTGTNGTVLKIANIRKHNAKVHKKSDSELSLKCDKCPVILSPETLENHLLAHPDHVHPHPVTTPTPSKLVKTFNKEIKKKTVNKRPPPALVSEPWHVVETDHGSLTNKRIRSGTAGRPTHQPTGEQTHRPKSFYDPPYIASYRQPHL